MATYNIKKGQLQKFIQEQTEKELKILKLKHEKEQLVRQLNELYSENGDMMGSTMDSDTASIFDKPSFETSHEEDIDEIDFKKIGQKVTDFMSGGSREQLGKKFLDFKQKQKAMWMQKNPEIGAKIYIPEPGTPDFEAAIDAVMRHGVNIVKNREGKWTPVTRPTGGADNAFDRP